MGRKVIIDIGHQSCDSGAVANGFREVDLNISIAKYATQELVRHGLTVKNTSGSLANRCNLEKQFRPEYFVSIHNNAGKGDGTEVFSLSTKGKGREIASSILNQITKVDKLNNSRGLKTSGFYVFKNTISPACLIECAFIDSSDVQAVDEEHERKAFGIAIAHGILAQMGIAEKGIVSTPSKELYRVKVDGKQIGAYSNIDNILEVVEKNIKSGDVEIEKV